MAVYKLFWDEFSSWYLEMIKPAYQKPIDRATYNATISFFEKLTLLLHPFMPFITEEIWQVLDERREGESVMVAPMPEAGAINAALLADFEFVKEIIADVRTVRLDKNIPNKEALTLVVTGEGHNDAYNSVIAKMCNLESIAHGEKMPQPLLTWSA